MTECLGLLWRRGGRALGVATVGVDVLSRRVCCHQVNQDRFLANKDSTYLCSDETGPAVGEVSVDIHHRTEAVGVVDHNRTAEVVAIQHSLAVD